MLTMLTEENIASVVCKVNEDREMAIRLVLLDQIKNFTCLGLEAYKIPLLQEVKLNDIP